MANPQLQQVIDTMWWKLVPYILVVSFVGTFAGLFVKWLERKATAIGKRRKQKQTEFGRQPRSQTEVGNERSEAAPHCPECNELMVKRKAKRGARAGSEFWGCPRYPGCRGTRAVG